MKNKIILLVFSVCILSCGRGSTPKNETSTSSNETNETIEPDFFDLIWRAVSVRKEPALFF